MASWFARWRERNASVPETVRIEGACTMSGQCCRNLILVHGGNPIKSHAGFLRMCAHDRESRMFQPRDKVSSDGLLRFSCKNLGPDSRCQIYASRPEMCREYPAPAMFERGGTLLAGCGYRVVRREPGAFEGVLEEAIELGQRNRTGEQPSTAAQNPANLDTNR